MMTLLISMMAEGGLILALSYGAVSALRASGIYSDVIITVASFYPFTEIQVFILFILLACMLGVFMVFALGTGGLKWFAFPIVLLCVPSIISNSDLPRLLKDYYSIELDIPVLQSDFTLTYMLILALLLVAGFVLLHQLVSLREMQEQLTRRGVDDPDIMAAYKGRAITIVVIVVIAVMASYLVSYYSSGMKSVFSERLELSPMVWLGIGIGSALIAIAIIHMLLVTQKPETAVVGAGSESSPNRLRQGIAREASAVITMVMPMSVARVFIRTALFAGRSFLKLERFGFRRVRISIRRKRKNELD
jgi:hypothetical protein